MLMVEIWMPLKRDLKSFFRGLQKREMLNGYTVLKTLECTAALSRCGEVMCPVEQRSAKGSDEVYFALIRVWRNEFRVERQQSKHRCGVEKNSEQLYFILHKSNNVQLTCKTNQFVLAPKLFA